MNSSINEVPGSVDEDQQYGKVRMEKVICLSPRKIAGLLLSVVGLLLLANLMIIYLRFVKGFEHLRGFIHGFYFDAEANFPSFYSAAAICFCSVVLWIIGSLPQEKHAKQSFYWKLLSVVFAFLALDEFASLHEYMIQPLRNMMDQSSYDSDYLYFAWFIPYVVILLILTIALSRFFLKLPRQTRWLFILGGIVFLLGAVGMEMVGGKYWATQGWAIDGSDSVDVRYALIVTLEELLEMLGIVIFIYALTLYYLKEQKREHTVVLKIDDGI